MPAIVLFGRGWQFSSDDLVFTSLYAIFMRLLGTLLVGIPLILFCNDPAICIPQNLFRLTCAGIAINILQLLIRCVLAFASSRGGVAEVSKRHSVAKLFYLQLLLMIVEFPLYSTILYFETSEANCPQNICICIRLGCIFGIVFLIGSLIAFAVTFDSTGRTWKNTHEIWCMELDGEKNLLNRAEAHDLNARLWKRRIACLSCLTNVCQHHNADAQENVQYTLRLVSDIAGHYFMTNMVYSDFLSGMVLLRWQTQHWVGGGHRVSLSQIERDSDPFDAVANQYPLAVDNQTVTSSVDEEGTPMSRLKKEWLSVHRMTLYFRFAEAIYGPLLYLYANKLSPRICYNILRNIPCCCCVSRCNKGHTNRLPSEEFDPMSTNSENYEIGCCACDRSNCSLATFIEMTNVPLTNLIYYSSMNAVCFSPFLVCIDDKTESVVISIRGTMSAQDIIVDLLAEGKHILASEVPDDCAALMPGGHLFAHMGMLQTARKIRDSITDMRLVEKARERRRGKNGSDYPLVVVGHSLGAGVASILALLLKRQYPEVKAYAYSPPLGLMNSRLANYCKTFVVSIIYGFDIVPRLSIPTMNDLKWRFFDALANCNVPKHRLLARSGMIMGMRFLLPACCRPSTSVGLDSSLFDLNFQHRLLYPVILVPRSSSCSTSSDCLLAGAPEDVHTMEADNVLVAKRSYSGLANEPTSSTNGRFLPDGRSLVRWLREIGCPVLRSAAWGTVFGTFYTTPMGTVEQGIYDVSGSVTSVTEQLADWRQGGEETPLNDIVSMDTNVRFAGLAFHIVEVTDDTGASSSLNKSARPPPVGIWSSSRQFQSILVHSRMMRDHLPHVLGRALIRLSDATGTEDPFSSSSSSFGRIRKLKRCRE